MKQQQEVKDISSCGLSERLAADHIRCGADALIEMGVRTGLSLVFSLIRESWTRPGSSSSLCNEVLKTAIEVHEIIM